MDDRPQHQAQGIYQDMTFAAGELLDAIIAVRAAALGGLDRLAINDSGTGGRLSPRLLSHLFPQRRVEPFPDASIAPFSEVVVDRRPGWKLPRQETPLATTAQHVENTIQNAAEFDRA